MNRTKEWEKSRAKLKKIYKEKEITTCELGFDCCWKNNALSFAHKHKRRFYYDKPGLIGTFNQTILACTPCHERIEDNKELTEEVFKRLRPE